MNPLKKKVLDNKNVINVMFCNSVSNSKNNKDILYRSRGQTLIEFDVSLSFPSLKMYLKFKQANYYFTLREKVP